jgi:hypothetical protein
VLKLGVASKATCSKPICSSSNAYNNFRNFLVFSYEYGLPVY